MLMICLKSWECSIMPDWLLIWKQYNDELVLVMTNTGSHSDVFWKQMKMAWKVPQFIQAEFSKTYLQ